MNKKFYDDYRVQSENYGLFGSDALFSTGWMGVLPAKAKDLYLALKSYMNTSSNVAWPSTKRLELDTLMNGTDIRTSVEFLNLVGLINIIERGSSFTGKSTEYQLREMYTLNMILEPLYLDILYKILKQREIKTRGKKANKNNENVYNQRLNKVKEYIEIIKEKGTKLNFKVRGELEKGILIDDYKYERSGKIINNSTEYDYLEKSKLMIIKDLMQALYTALRVSSKNEKYNNYNGLLVSSFLNNLEVLRYGEKNSESEIDDSNTEENIPNRGSNIQESKQENKQSNNDDDSIQDIGIIIPNFEEEDMSNPKDKALKYSKVEKLLRDIERQLISFNVSENQLEAIMTVLKIKDLQHLEKVFDSINYLLEVDFQADNNNSYAWKLCNEPNPLAAENTARSFKNNNLQERNKQKSNEVENSRGTIKARKHDDPYYLEFFGLSNEKVV